MERETDEKGMKLVGMKVEATIKLKPSDTREDFGSIDRNHTVYGKSSIETFGTNRPVEKTNLKEGTMVMGS